MARAGDGPPGAQSLTEGLKALQAIVWYVRQSTREGEQSRQRRRRPKPGDKNRPRGTLPALDRQPQKRRTHKSG